jgi:hypothetical protein
MRFIVSLIHLFLGSLAVAAFAWLVLFVFGYEPSYRVTFWVCFAIGAIIRFIGWSSAGNR